MVFTIPAPNPASSISISAVVDIYTTSDIKALALTFEEAM
jgi:hypothetical protein